VGAGKFAAFCKQSKVILGEDHEAEAASIVTAYREAVPGTVRFWRKCEGALRNLTQGGHGTLGRGDLIRYGMVDTPVGKIPSFILPDGYRLLYPELEHTQTDEHGWPGFWYTQFSRGRSQKKHIYGGLLTENLIQGMAFAIIRWQMCQIQIYLPTRLNVHDSVAVTVPDAPPGRCLTTGCGHRHRGRKDSCWIAKAESGKGMGRCEMKLTPHPRTSHSNSRGVFPFLPRVPEVVGQLAPQPTFCGRPIKPRFETKRQIERNRRLPVNHTGKPHTAYTERFCSISHGKTENGQNILFQSLPRMRRVVHSAHNISLMVVLIVNQDSIFALKSKSKSPVAAYRHCPVFGQITGKRVQPPPGHIHVPGRTRIVQLPQLPRQPWRMIWTNTRLTACFKKCLKPLMSKVPDHARNYILYRETIQPTVTIEVKRSC
jgi:hypothetical protein